MTKANLRLAAARLGGPAWAVAPAAGEPIEFTVIVASPVIAIDAIERIGIPGSAILSADMDVGRASGIPVVRQWDRA